MRQDSSVDWYRPNVIQTRGGGLDYSLLFLAAIISINVGLCQSALRKFIEVGMKQAYETDDAVP